MERKPTLKEENGINDATAFSCVNIDLREMMKERTERNESVNRIQPIYDSPGGMNVLSYELVNVLTSKLSVTYSVGDEVDGLTERSFI